jgi:4-hydroxy-4-methyl-2-oxoglutarate aldolase
MKKILFFISLLSVSYLQAQVPNMDMMRVYTEEWTGERFEDGRPKVPEAILKRMEKVSIEEAWGFMRNKGFHNQFAGDWEILHPDQVMVGRALTVQFMPNRPDYAKRMLDKGHAEGRLGAMNSWPIDMLQKDDIYVADGYGKIVDGTLIGDNLGNAIYAKSGKGVVFNASSRDLEGLERIDGFNAWVKGWDPSFLTESMVTGINTPIRMGTATVFPGDVVLAKKEGVIFIPAHLAEELVINAEFVMLRDKFGIMRLKEGKYTPGQIDTRWTEAIKADFLEWVNNNQDQLPMSKAELDAYLKDRNW